MTEILLSNFRMIEYTFEMTQSTFEMIEYTFRSGQIQLTICKFKLIFYQFEFSFTKLGFSFPKLELSFSKLLIKPTLVTIIHILAENNSKQPKNLLEGSVHKKVLTVIEWVGGQIHI